MLRKAAICAFLASASLLVGCGESEDSTAKQDEEDIVVLVDKINEASDLKDASRFCLLVPPSAIEEKFNGDIDNCVRETAVALKQAAESPVPDQPPLEVEEVEVDGDVATVRFAGSPAQEAKFVKEGDQWYLPLDQNEVVGTSSEGNGG